MIVTEVAIRKVSDKGNFLGSASITLDGAVIINDCKIMSGKNGKFVALPDRKGTDGKYYHTVYIADKRLLEDVNAKVIEAYEKE